MDNKTKVDRIHDLLPKFLNSRNNTNWKALIDALGQEDEKLAQLVAEVRQQFFVKTATRPYIDVLAANNNISRPKLVGMSDQSFSQYIPVLSYQPKQVKLIIDQLLDIFFFKDATTAFLKTSLFQPFALEDGWELNLLIDGTYIENIRFNQVEFTNIAAATADEIVAAYNRQAQYSYATNYYDSITKHNYIRIFTKTVGSKGSLEIQGGRVNIAFQLNGFLTTAGNGVNTQWTVSKVGDTTTFAHTGGASPGIANLQAGDILISNLSGNVGSFVITNVDVSNDKIQFLNLFSTPGVYTQVSAADTKFIRPDKYTAYKVPRRAITWETHLGEVTVEMPTTPPVVRRTLRGGMHINGALSLTTSFDSLTSLTLVDASGFPAESGSFVIEPVDAVTSRIITQDTNEVVTISTNGRLIYRVQKYTYTSRVILATSGTTTAGSNQITVASVVGLSNGNTIFAPGLAARAVITNIAGNLITSSQPFTEDLAAATIKFGGNQLTGISPNLPSVSTLDEEPLSSLSRTSGVVTATTTTTNDYEVGDSVIMYGSDGITILSTTGDTNSNLTLTNLVSTLNVSPGQLVTGTGIPTGTKVELVLSPTSVQLSRAATATAVGVSIKFGEDLNGTFTIQTASPTQFTYNILGTDGAVTTPGISGIERLVLSNENSKVILTQAQNAVDTGIVGPYVWDTKATYVLSSATAEVLTEIKAGKIIRLLDIGPNEIPNQQGFLIFDYGLNTQEGPVRYLYKPADNVVALDPSYIFQKDHSIGSAVVVISHKGPHQMSGLADEYGPYLTDPSQARLILEALIESVTSAGIFVNFLVRFPEQLYGTLDVYNRAAG